MRRCKGPRGEDPDHGIPDPACCQACRDALFLRSWLQDHPAGQVGDHLVGFDGDGYPLEGSIADQAILAVRAAESTARSAREEQRRRREWQTRAQAAREDARRGARELGELRGRVLGLARLEADPELLAAALPPWASRAVRWWRGSSPSRVRLQLLMDTASAEILEGWDGWNEPAEIPESRVWFGWDPAEGPDGTIRYRLDVHTDGTHKLTRILREERHP